MTPPIWLDEHGRPHPTYPCFTCGAEQSGGILSGRDLRHQGWLLSHLDLDHRWA